MWTCMCSWHNSPFYVTFGILGHWGSFSIAHHPNCLLDMPSWTLVMVYSTYSFCKHFNIEGVNKLLIYILPLIIEYKHAHLFTKLTSMRFATRTPILIDTNINVIQEGGVEPYVMTAITSSVRRLGFWSVSWKEEWLMLSGLVLVHLEKIFTLIFLSRFMHILIRFKQTCLVFTISTNFCNKGSLACAFPLTWKTTSFVFVHNFISSTLISGN